MEYINLFAWLARQRIPAEMTLRVGQDQHKCISNYFIKQNSETAKRSEFNLSYDHPLNRSSIKTFKPLSPFREPFSLSICSADGGPKDASRIGMKLLIFPTTESVSFITSS